MKQLSTIIFLLSAFSLFAQQEPHYTYFMYNQQLYNPAYVGSRNTASFTGLHRSQWLGFEGAPSSQVLSFQTPIMKQRAGVGGTISRQEIGISYNWFGSAAYAYRLRLTQELDLRIGIQATLEYLGLQFSDPKVVTVSPNDPSLSDGSFQDKYTGNVGVGMHLMYKNLFYFGASSPQIYPNDIGFNDLTKVTAQMAPHRYFSLGAAIPVTEELELMPNMLMKWVDHAPLDFDINFSVRYMEKVMAGVTYRAGGNRYGESVDFLLFMQFHPKFGAGLSYDLTLSDIRDYQSGTIELMVRYDLRDEKGDLENPRFFKKK
jgi:type IX secretion system PorP/SprF family membrane protein